MSFSLKGNRSKVMKHRGFTLVEMIVALGIFAVVATVALGALTKIISANRKAQTLQASITNINYALESMSREMRVGTNYHCRSSSNSSYTSTSISGNDLDACDDGTGLSGALNAFVIFKSTKTKTSTDGNSVCNLIYAYRFRLVDGGYLLEKGKQTACGGQITGFSSIMDKSVVINNYNIRGVDGDYPLLTIKISGYVGEREREKTYFDVQTAVSPRIESI